MSLLLLALAVLTHLAKSDPCICLTCPLTDRQNWGIFSDAMAPELTHGTCHISRPYPEGAAPKRGEIIVFSTKTQPAPVIFRVIGLGGDRVQMQHGQALLNGRALPQTRVDDYLQVYAPQGPQRILPRCPQPTGLGKSCTILQFEETLPSGLTYLTLDITGSRLDDTAEFIVPEGHVFVLGDNRDNANDSRVPLTAGGPGIVPIARIIARIARPATP